MAVTALVAVGLLGCGFMLYVLFQWTRDGVQPQPIEYRDGIDRSPSSEERHRKTDTSQRPPLDIFKLEPDGSLVWKGTATDLGSAELNVKVLATDSPGEYVVYSQQTRHKVVVKLDTEASSK
jgi:hypothetical protein